MVRTRCSLAARAGTWAAVIGTVILASISTTTSALAQTNPKTAEARDAFDQGTAAYAQKDFSKAAEYFARADELIPSEEALEAAIDCATRANDAVLAMRLVDRAARSPNPSKGLEGAKRTAQEKLGSKAGRVIVKCSVECAPTLDGRTIAAGVPTWTLVGSHAVVAVRPGHESARASATVNVASDRLAELTLELPADGSARDGPPIERPAPAPSSGLSPVWVWIGAGATVLLGGAAVVSGVQTLGHSDDFKKAGCTTQGSDQCSAIADDGRSARLRTNIFIGGASVTAVASVLLAAFFVDWHRGSRSTTTALPFSIGPGSVAYTRTWP